MIEERYVSKSYSGEKGGTGKSTTAVNLSIMASLMEHDVMLVDANKQASSAKFLSRRKELGIKPTPACVRIQGKYLHDELNDIAKRYQIVFVDAGGFDSVELRSAMSGPCITKMYSPIKVGDFDLQTVDTMNQLVYQARSYNPNLVCYMLLTQCSTQVSEKENIESTVDCIKSYEFLDLAETKIYHRTSVSSAPTYGLSVVEFEEERRQKMPGYRIKEYLYKGSIEFCNLYEEALGTKFINSLFPTLEIYQQNSSIIEEAVA